MGVLKMGKCALCATLFVTGLAGCATESHRALQPETTAAAQTQAAYNGPRTTLVVGKFDNRSSYMRGRFPTAWTGSEARRRRS